MLTGKAVYNKIDEIVDAAYLNFLFLIVGEQFLSDDQKRKVESLGLIIGQRPLIELLYILIRNRPTEGYAKDRTLNELLDQIAATGILPIINDTQQSTIDEGKLAFAEAVENTKNELKKRVKHQIIQANKEAKKEITVKRYINLAKEKEKAKDHTLLLLAGIAGLSDIVRSTFEKAFTSQLTDFINETTVDTLTEIALFTGQPIADTKVFKEVKNDGRLCEWCHRFYLDSKGKPKIYTLSELQANGTNYGKPKSKWRPVIGSTHIRCRCQLRLVR